MGADIATGINGIKWRCNQCCGDYDSNEIEAYGVSADGLRHSVHGPTDYGARLSQRSIRSNEFKSRQSRSSDPDFHKTMNFRTI